MEEKYLIVSEEPLIQLRHAFFETSNVKYQDRIIVMIPGWLSSIEERMTIIESLRSISNIIIYEPRGFGKSTAPEKKGFYGIDDCTSDFVKIIELYNLQDREFFVWGSSYGSAIALQYSVKSLGPQPSAFILCSPESSCQTRWWIQMMQYLPKFFYAFLSRIVLLYINFSTRKKNPDDSHDISKTIKDIKERGIFVQIRIYFECLAKYNIEGLEHKIGSPLLIFIAQKDWFSKPENSKKLAEFHPDSRVITVGESHRSIVENPGVLTKHISDYIQKLENQ